VCGWQVKLCDPPCYTWAISEHFRDKELIIKRFFTFTLLCVTTANKTFDFNRCNINSRVGNQLLTMEGLMGSGAGLWWFGSGTGFFSTVGRRLIGLLSNMLPNPTPWTRCGRISCTSSVSTASTSVLTNRPGINRTAEQFHKLGLATRLFFSRTHFLIFSIVHRVLEAFSLNATLIFTFNNNNNNNHAVEFHDDVVALQLAVNTLGCMNPKTTP